MTLAEKALEGNNPQRGVCGICPAGCWVEISFDSDGKISEVRADSNPNWGCSVNWGRIHLKLYTHRIDYCTRYGAEVRKGHTTSSV